jgi:hypothetical protein
VFYTIVFIYLIFIFIELAYPKMKKIKFPLATLEAIYSYGLVEQIDSIFEFMHSEIKNGNSIVIETNNRLSEKSSSNVFFESSELNQFQNEFIKKNSPPLNILLERRQRINSNSI